MVLRSGWGGNEAGGAPFTGGNAGTRKVTTSRINESIYANQMTDLPPELDNGAGSGRVVVVAGGDASGKLKDSAGGCGEGGRGAEVGCKDKLHGGPRGSRCSGGGGTYIRAPS